MCGINGLIFLKDRVGAPSGLSDLVSKMNGQILHRGPNGADVKVINAHSAVGNVRLSILDIEKGHLPMEDEVAGNIIAYNGEVYNYIELRERLLQQGVVFHTESDAEVVLKMYRIYGKECVQHFVGMFAFSIYDKRKNAFFIVRDRVGEKPLYYFKDDQKFVWSSELKSIVKIFPALKEIDIEALNLFLALTYIPAPFSIYKNIKKIEPGSYIWYDLNSKEMFTARYWDISLEKPNLAIDYEQAQEKLKNYMIDVVKQTSRSDVPLGVFLSGGVDSSILAALLSKQTPERVKTFSVKFKEKDYDESYYARELAEHINADHHEFIFKMSDVTDIVDQVILNFDEPFADSSALPTYFIGHKASDFVKVVLSGDGADEIFAGYNKYLMHTWGEKYKKIFPTFFRESFLKPLIRLSIFRSRNSKSLINKIRKLINSIEDNYITSHLNIISLGFKKPDLIKLLKPLYFRKYRQLLVSKYRLSNLSKYERLKVIKYIDAKISLEGDMLVKVDRTSMLNSLEVRAPFLDHRIIDFTSSLRSDFLIKDGNRKRILKDTFSDLVPDKFFERKKSGFELPLSDWLRGDMKEDVKQTLSYENLNRHGYFNQDYIEKLIKKHMSGRYDFGPQIWNIYCFQKWFNKNMI